MTKRNKAALIVLPLLFLAGAAIFLFCCNQEGFTGSRVKNPDANLPVGIASHGSCGSIDNNRSLYREFASHGYVVLAVSHPDHTFDTLHSNGKKQKVSMDYLKEMGGMDPQTELEAAANLFAQWMELRMTDLAAVMDDFADRAVQNLDKCGSADTSHFVALGHSAGSSIALGMTKMRKERQ